MHYTSLMLQNCETGKQYIVSHVGYNNNASSGWGSLFYKLEQCAQIIRTSTQYNQASMHAFGALLAVHMLLRTLIQVYIVSFT